MGLFTRKSAGNNKLSLVNDQELSKRAAAHKAMAALDNVSNAVMMVDRNFVVTYINKSTTALLALHVDEFRKLWPTFDPNAIVGTCIDTFHKKPSHQRGMLAAPPAKPFRTDIAVGQLKFALSVTATFDSDGHYDGNMLEWADVTSARIGESQLKAIDRSQAIIQFTLDGRIREANENFLHAMGYTLAEIQGKHHSMFVDPAFSSSAEYTAFWEKLGRGEYDAGQYRRLCKGGREIWLQASYNPVLDGNGRPFMVIKYATDVTAQVMASRALELAVKETHEVVKHAMEGDLTARIPLKGKASSIEQLCSGINALVDNMATVVGRVKEATEAIDTAAHEITQGNTDLSSRTEEQASSLEETASSMEELTGTVKQNADNARQASQLAASASGVAIKGGEVVREVVSTMNGISDSSKRIADIIGVIDGIAFQTNILALNAAVEAARAGEQGRGFAVVATEVRNLAQRSANAAKEIKDLITESVHKVEAGSSLVHKAGKTMEEIVASVGRVTDIMADIATASLEQSSGIEQVNRAITQMDEVTQQNAALVEEAAAAAESMQEQVGSLLKTVAQFRMDTEIPGTTTPERGRAGLPNNLIRLPSKVTRTQ